MSPKLIVSALAIAFSAALSACSAVPTAGAAEMQMPASTPPAVSTKTPFDAPTPSSYAGSSGADRDGAIDHAARRADCDIRVSRTGNGVAIAPVAMADRAFAGEYSLVLTKNGASGSSDVTQGGPFSARAGETVKLGQTELSLSRRDHYRIVLTLTDGGREVCRREIRS